MTDNPDFRAWLEALTGYDADTVLDILQKLAAADVVIPSYRHAIQALEDKYEDNGERARELEREWAQAHREAAEEINRIRRSGL